jgi:hypothetical protein
MMMPMGGAGSGSGSTAGGGAASGTAASGGLKGTSAASAGTGASGFSGTSGAGVGGLGAGFGGSGLGAGSLAGGGGAVGGLSGLGSGLGSGGLSGSGSSWGSPSFGTGAAGLSDPTTDLPGTDPGSTTGGFTVPTVPTMPTPTVPTPTVPTVPTIPTPTPAGSSSPIKLPSTPSASGIKAPSGGGAGGMPGGGAGGGASANTSDLGVKTVKASPEMLHKEALHWDDTSKEFTANATNPIGNQSPSSVDFGMMKDAFGPYNDLLTRLKKWSTGAGTEFSAISDALQAASGGYSDTEATNTTTATHTGSFRPE